MKMSETATKLSVKASTARRITANCLLRDARNTSALRSTAEEGWGATGRKKGEERACGGKGGGLGGERNVEPGEGGQQDRR